MRETQSNDKFLQANTRISQKAILFNKYQKKLFDHKPAKVREKLVEGDLEKEEEEEVQQGARTLKVDLNVPKSGIGGGPRFLVQFESQNHLFLDENEKVRSNLSNTLRELVKIDHSVGKDFKYFHVEALVKSFLPLQLVSNSQIEEMNKQKIEKLKKDYEKVKKKNTQMPSIKEEPNEEKDSYSEMRKTKANNSFEEDRKVESKTSLLNEGVLQKIVKNKVSSLNSSLRSDQLLAESINFERRRRAWRSLKNEEFRLGYKGGNKQYVSGGRLMQGGVQISNQRPAEPAEPERVQFGFGGTEEEVREDRFVECGFEGELRARKGVRRLWGICGVEASRAAPQVCHLGY